MVKDQLFFLADCYYLIYRFAYKTKKLFFKKLKQCNKGKFRFFRDVCIDSWRYFAHFRYSCHTNVHGVTGEYTDKTMWYIIGGIALILAGAGLTRM